MADKKNNVKQVLKDEKKKVTEARRCHWPLSTVPLKGANSSFKSLKANSDNSSKSSSDCSSVSWDDDYELNSARPKKRSPPLRKKTARPREDRTVTPMRNKKPSG